MDIDAQTRALLETIMQSLARQTRGQQMAMEVFNVLIMRYSGSEDFVPMLFALRDILNKITHNLPLQTKKVSGYG